MNYQDIEQFTSVGSYQVDIFLDYFMNAMDRYAGYGLILNPDFQRGHVWTEAQQVEFIEFLLRGGRSGKIIYFNHPNWMSGLDGEFVVVDGLQRITALQRFYRNEIKAFGKYEKEFTGKPGFECGLKFNINNLKTRREVLQWYLELNSGGTPHKESELDRVREMIKKELKK